MSGAITTGYHSDHVAWLEFSNPGKRNALSLSMWDDLPAKLAALSDNANLRVLIVSGAGEHFSSGGDISEFETLFGTPEAAMAFGESIDAAFDALVNFRVPTIAKIRGGAVGGGCGLALACDIRISDKTSFFAVTPAKLGIIYPFPEIARLVSTVGLSAAKDILFSARLIKTKEARRMGLVNQVFPSDDLDAEVLAYAQTLAARSPNSLAQTKRIMAHIEAGHSEASPEIIAAIKDAFLGDDFKEGYRAFLEKRTADF